MTADDSSLSRDPLFSICIPQHNRTSFLLEALESYRQQDFNDFELCISDDCSTDGRGAEIEDFLRNSGMRYRFQRRASNGRYDKNLRSSIDLASGRYCLLMGNDDLLVHRGVLGSLASTIESSGWPAVIVTNYRELSTGKEYRRIAATAIRGAGPEVAARNFRNYAFVSGVAIERSRAVAHATDRWDGSEMYQMYLATRTIAAGGALLGIADVMVGKDIQIPGEAVASFATRPREKGWPIRALTLPLTIYGRVAADAVRPYLSPDNCEAPIRSIFEQFVVFTYPPWILEYRRRHSWFSALGLCLGMRRRSILGDTKVGLLSRWYLAFVYLIVTAAGLTLPIRLFDAMKERLHALAKA